MEYSHEWGRQGVASAGSARLRGRSRQATAAVAPRLGASAMSLPCLFDPSPACLQAPQLCIGCGLCVKKCPFEAISIINLPSNLSSETTHRYGPNAFKLHRLPMPRPGEVLGLVGTNGIGKSTALKVLADKLKPNLGEFAAPPTWEEILKHFRGSELQGYFTKLLDKKLKAVIKIQYVDSIPRAIKGTVGKLVKRLDGRGVREEMLTKLQLDHVADREVELLSGGELQRFAICVVAVQDAQVYMFDEPSSYLDIKQRLIAGRVIRDVLADDTSGSKYVICVEHDLAVLDYLSDFICCLYGVPGAYGVVTMPFSVREGINIFLAGYVPTENLRFRDEALTFKVSTAIEDAAEASGDAMASRAAATWPDMTTTLVSKSGSKFILHVESGSFSTSEIIVLLGENGTGKTTFVKMLAGKQVADIPEGETEPPEVAGFEVSFKPQKIAPKFPGTVQELLLRRIPKAFGNSTFQTNVCKPLKIDPIRDQRVQNLSGGELQRVALAMTLGKPADVYLIDEPSAYLDSEQRIVAAKVIKRYILNAKRTGFIVGEFPPAPLPACQPARLLAASGLAVARAVPRVPPPFGAEPLPRLAALRLTLESTCCPHPPAPAASQSTISSWQRTSRTA